MILIHFWNYKISHLILNSAFLQCLKAILCKKIFRTSRIPFVSMICAFFKYSFIIIIFSHDYTALLHTYYKKNRNSKLGNLRNFKFSNFETFYYLWFETLKIRININYINLYKNAMIIWNVTFIFNFKFISIIMILLIHSNNSMRYIKIKNYF